MIPVRDTSAGVAFAVKVQPRARKNAITGAVGDALRNRQRFAMLFQAFDAEQFGPDGLLGMR